MYESKGLKVAKTFKQKKAVKLTYEAPVVMTGPVNLHCSTRIGSFTSLASCRIKALKVIGRYCTVAEDVLIGDHVPAIEWLSTSGFQYSPESFAWFSDDMRRLATPGVIEFKKRDGNAVVIGHDVWIGAGAQIMRGVTIESGAVVEAGAVVTKDVGPYEIVAGVPATRVGFRFSQGVIDRLLTLSWWQYHPTDLAGIDFSNINSAIDELRRRHDGGSILPWEGNWKILKDGVIYEDYELP